MFQETQDIRRQKFAISSYVDLKGGTFKKLGANDVDYKLFDNNGNITSYVELTHMPLVGDLIYILDPLQQV